MFVNLSFCFLVIFSCGFQVVVSVVMVLILWYEKMSLMFKKYLMMFKEYYGV